MNEKTSLQAQIDAVEARLGRRRSRAVGLVRAIGRGVRKRMTAPSTLLFAFGVGVVVESGSRNTTLVGALRALGAMRDLTIKLTALVQTLDAATA